MKSHNNEATSPENGENSPERGMLEAPDTSQLSGSEASLSATGDPPIEEDRATLDPHIEESKAESPSIEEESKTSSNEEAKQPDTEESPNEETLNRDAETDDEVLDLDDDLSDSWLETGGSSDDGTVLISNLPKDTFRCFKGGKGDQGTVGFQVFDTGTLKIQSPVERPAHNVTRVKSNQYVIMDTGIIGNLRSRRYQASHYGIAVAGYVCPVEDYRRELTSLMKWQIPEITIADPLLGLRPDATTVVQDEDGLWPFGLFRADKVVWLPIPNLRNCKRTDDAADFSSALIKGVFEFPTNAKAFIAEVETGSKTENMCFLREGKPVRIWAEATPKRPQLAFLGRCAAMISNMVRLEGPLFDGPFPNLDITMEGEEIEHLHLRSAFALIDVCEALSLGQESTDVQICKKSRTYWMFNDWEADGDDDQDSTFAECLSIKKAFSLPGFSLHADSLAELNSDFEFERIETEEEVIESEAGDLSSYSGPPVEVTVPGTTSVSLAEARILRCIPVPAGVIPLSISPVHPISRFAQMIYNKCVASCERDGIWFQLELPTREVARASIRTRKPGVGSRHIGDENYGDQIVNNMVVAATPKILYFQPLQGKVPNGDSALTALVRAAYSHGSSCLGFEEMIRASCTEVPRAPQQSYVGLRKDGSIDAKYYEKDDVQILHDHVKKELDQVRLNPDRLREFAIDLLSLQRYQSHHIPVVGMSTDPCPSSYVHNRPLSLQPEKGVLEIPVHQPLSDAQAAELASFLSDFSYNEVLKELGPRTLQITEGSTSKMEVGVQQEPFSDVVSIERVCGALLGSRCLKAAKPISKAPSTLLSAAKNALTKDLSGPARASLLQYLHKKGPILSSEAVDWRKAELTFEVIDIEVSQFQVSEETTWNDLLWEASRGVYVKRNSPSAIQNANSTHDAVVKKKKRKKRKTQQTQQVQNATAGQPQAAAAPPDASGVVSAPSSDLLTAVQEMSESDGLNALREAFDKKSPHSKRFLAQLIFKLQSHTGVDQIYQALTGGNDSYLSSISNGYSGISLLAKAVKGGASFQEIVEGGASGPKVPNPIK